MEETVHEDDEDDDIGKTLHAKDGKVLTLNTDFHNYNVLFPQLGMITWKGFKANTNFIVDIAAQVYSEKFNVKGKIINIPPP